MFSSCNCLSINLAHLISIQGKINFFFLFYKWLCQWILPFHKWVVFAVSHQISIYFIVWHVHKSLQDHNGRHKKNLLLIGETKIGRAVVQVVQYVILADLINAHAMDRDTVLSVGGASTLPRRSYQCHRLKINNAIILIFFSKLTVQRDSLSYIVSTRHDQQTQQSFVALDNKIAA